MTLRAAAEILADISAELARAPADIEAILVLATSRLSRIAPGTWIAVVMNPNPETSRVVVANERDRDVADYVEAYIAGIDRPQRAPTVGLSQQVIESGSPIAVENISFDELLLMLSPVGQAYCLTNPPPHRITSVGLLIVPMRVGGATLGTLGVFDTQDRHLLDESDIDWIQLVADRMALSLDHARLTGGALVHAAEMETVHAVALASRGGPDLRLTLAAILERVTALPSVDAADILLMTGDGNEASVAATAGFRSPWSSELRFEASWAGLDRQVGKRQVSYGAASGLKIGHPRRSQFVREGFQTLIGVPLYSNDRPLGILNLYCRAVVEWEQDRLEFLDALGGLVAMAIDRSTQTSTSSGTRVVIPPGLSDLDVEILRLIAEGLTNREIAAHVYRSENTVKFHVRRILEKTDAANRTDLVRLALREGWLSSA